MLNGWIIFLVSALYIGLLFAIAFIVDKRAEGGRSLVNNAYVYALSMGVYCTAWTFYGSVGRAASTGIGFLPIYLGPTLMAALWWFVLRKIIRISRINHITSIADFIASRYGKSSLLGALVTVIAVLGIVPYIALQLKAITTSFMLLWKPLEMDVSTSIGGMFTVEDTAFYVAVLLAAFAMLFGARHLDVTEHHQGLMAAIAFESVIKLLAFLAVGLFVTFGLYRGPGDLFAQAASVPELRALFTFSSAPGAYADWAWLLLLSMLAILFLPRQFQVSVVENMDERHLDKAVWLFPLYLLVINLFVLPIAFAGRLRFGSAVDADLFVLTLPIASDQAGLALFVFIGGLSAATSMVIVATVALSNMVCNDLVMPILLAIKRLRLAQRTELGGLLLTIRRAAIVSVLLLGYIYLRLMGETYTLVSIGLISFVAVAQFAPAILGGIYWKRATRAGALVGLLGGFLVWGYTLPLTSLVSSGLLSEAWLTAGPWGLWWLRPQALFGLEGMDPISHTMLWSTIVNVGAYVGVSLWSQQSALEHSQATLFVDVFEHAATDDPFRLWRGEASAATLRALLERFLGAERSERHLLAYARRNGLTLDELLAGEATGALVAHAERLLAGAIGAASARVAIGSVVREERVGIDEVMRVLQETSQVVAYSRQLEEHSQQLERKSLELERATADLRAANERLQELDRLKDDFIASVTHELRTPLTSILAFSQILHDSQQIDEAQRVKFLSIIVEESERLTRLINQVLNLSKLESHTAALARDDVDARALVEEALAALDQLFVDHNIQVDVDLGSAPVLHADGDRIKQVLINLLSNAIKFCDAQAGWIGVQMRAHAGWLRIDVSDNGRGLSAAAQRTIFDKFRQEGDSLTGKPQGTGLGLSISQRIAVLHGGRLWVESEEGKGATFVLLLPLEREIVVNGAASGRAALN